MPRRVVISGLAAVTPPGLGALPLWESLTQGRGHLGTPTRIDLSGFSSRLAGELKGFSGKDHVPKHYRKAVKVMARDIEIAVAAARLAVEDAGLITRGQGDTPRLEGTTLSPGRLGCHIGAGLIAAETLELAAAQATATEGGEFSLRAWGTIDAAGGMNNLQPLWMLKYLPNMPACHVTIIHGCEGPSNTITCAEASGLLSIAESRRVIERGDADACLSGGAESKLTHMGVLRWEFAGRLANTADATDGSTVIRPYDPASPGTLLGEGGAILVLEAADSASARGARVYAEVLGAGAGQSGPQWAIPPVAPGPLANDGLELAIRAALRDAALTPADIDAIVPQALGVPAIDQAELAALHAIFGDRLASLPLITTSPCTGDLAAGHGAVQALVGALCLHHQTIPARVHHGRPAPLAAGAAGPAAPRALRRVLVCSGSLGGQNAALILGR